MKTYRFRLAKVLDLRRAQLDSAEEKLQRLRTELSRLQSQSDETADAYQNSQHTVLTAPTLSGPELVALAAFRERTKRQLLRLAEQQHHCQTKIDDALRLLIKARQNLKVLEKLKEKQLQNWVMLNEREIESTAAEAHLVNWVRTEEEKRMATADGAHYANRG